MSKSYRKPFSLSFFCLFVAAEILGLVVNGRQALSGEELEAMDSFQLGDVVHEVTNFFLHLTSS